MRLYKPKYVDKKTGEQRESAKYYAGIVDHTHIRRRIPLTDNWDESIDLMRLVRDLVDNRRSRRRDSEATKESVAALPEIILKQFEKVPGLLDVTETSDHYKLTDHIEAFEKHLRNTRSEKNGRFRTARQVNAVVTKVRTVFENCNYYFWPDVEVTRIKEVLGAMSGRGSKPLTAATFNKYVQALHQFDNWLEESKRSPAVKLKSLKRLSENNGNEQPVRGLNYTEACNLIATTGQSEVCFGLKGIQRAVAYLIAIETGYRASELRSLLRKDCDLNNAVVTLAGQYTKSRKNACQHIKKSRAKQLRDFADLGPNDKALRLPSKYNMADMIRGDCELAGIPTERINFHSLRHTLANALDKARVTGKESNWIMRHADKELRQRVYTDPPSKDRLAEIAEQLWDLPWPEENIIELSGTEEAAMSLRSA